MTAINRRQFAMAASALSYSRILGANDRIQMGYIGLGNRGDQVHDAFLEWPDQVTTAICDLREDYLDFAAKKSRATPKRYSDYRKLLADKNVDAVMIATPDHWHALMFVDACHAGKDVYVEKPLSLTIAEGRRMVQVAQETKRVTQVGIHRRSGKSLQEAVKLVRSGALGKITVCKGWHLQNEWPNGIGNPGHGNPPSAELWDQWLGPAPSVPYNSNRTFYRFRWFYDYSGGQITNFGVHYMDMLRWAINEDAPVRVTALGGRYAVKDDREIPDTCEVLWEFPSGVLMVFSQYNANAAAGNAKNWEMEIRGTKGTLYLQSGNWEVIPEKTTDELVPDRTPLDREHELAWNKSKQAAMEPQSMKGTVDTRFHTRNFLDCLKSREKCNCDVLTGHLSTSAAIMGHIALRTHSTLEWDARQEKFTNNDAANELLRYKYRSPYKLG